MLEGEKSVLTALEDVISICVVYLYSLVEALAHDDLEQTENTLQVEDTKQMCILVNFLVPVLAVRSVSGNGVYF